MERLRYDLNVNNTMGDQWGVSDAIRELFSNAIDESKITKTPAPLFKWEGGRLEISDSGRGIRPEHFINDKNVEKEELDYTIGIFGVGLKDSLNVLFNKGCKTVIFSNYDVFEVERDIKPNTNAETLFIIHKKSNMKVNGTHIVIENVSLEDYNIASNMFINNKIFSIEFENDYGQVLLPGGEVYLNGVLISRSDELFYTYNITKPLKSMISKMSRERKEINKSAYMPALESLINKLSSQDFKKWISPYAENIYELGKFEFSRSKFLRRYQADFEKIISREQFDGLEQSKRNLLRDQGFLVVDKPGFDFDFQDEIINERDYLDFSSDEIELLSKVINECKKFDLPIVELRDVRIADKMSSNGSDALGLAKMNEKVIILEKNLFRPSNGFSLFKTYVHEASHIKSGFGDETRGFQMQLEENFLKLLSYILDKK